MDLAKSGPVPLSETGFWMGYLGPESGPINSIKGDWVWDGSLIGNFKNIIR